jgi:hypothetical protein
VRHWLCQCRGLGVIPHWQSQWHTSNNVIFERRATLTTWAHQKPGPRVRAPRCGSAAARVIGPLIRRALRADGALLFADCFRLMRLSESQQEARAGDRKRPCCRWSLGLLRQCSPRRETGRMPKSPWPASRGPRRRKSKSGSQPRWRRRRCALMHEGRSLLRKTRGYSADSPQSASHVRSKRNARFRKGSGSPHRPTTLWRREQEHPTLCQNGIVSPAEPPSRGHGGPIKCYSRHVPRSCQVLFWQYAICLGGRCLRVATMQCGDMGRPLREPFRPCCPCMYKSRLAPARTPPWSFDRSNNPSTATFPILQHSLRFSRGT